MVWTVVNAHYPALFVAGFLFFLGFDRATAAYSTLTDFRTPLLVGFFLAGLVVHGGLQAWWIGPVLARLSETPLFIGATILTAFNDNALITYLGTLVPNLSDSLKQALVAGRGDRRRAHGDRQRAEPGRPGRAGPVLRRRGPSALSVRRRRAADAGGRGDVPLVLRCRRSRFARHDAVRAGRVALRSRRTAAAARAAE